LSEPHAPTPAPSAAPLPATPRNVAAYLRAVRELMTEATTLRRSWIRQVGVLILDARAKPPEMVAPGAAHCGTEQRELFTGIRVRLGEIPVPRGCDVCHEAFVAWLEKQVGACDLLIEIGRTGELTTLKTVQRVLADSRTDTAAFNAAYTALVEGLKQQVNARKKTRLLFGRR